MARRLQSPVRYHNEAEYHRESIQVGRAFLDELSSVILSSAPRVHYLVGDYVYDSLDDVAKYESETLDELWIVGVAEDTTDIHKYSASIVRFNLTSYHTTLEWREGRGSNAIHFALARDLIHKQPKADSSRREALGLGTVAAFFYSAIAILAYLAVKQDVPPWLLWPAGTLFFLAHVGSVFASTSPKRIRLLEETTIRSFWRRNKDEIIKLLIAAIFGGLFAALFTFLIG